MKSVKKAVGFGLLAWGIPLVVAVAIFPLKRAGDPLFETIMPLVVTLCAIFFANAYFSRVNSGFVREGLLMGLMCMATSLALDSCLFTHGPMKMPLMTYLKDIGFGYLIFPTITLGLGWAKEGRGNAIGQVAA
jgi:hypothetical protein